MREKYERVTGRSLPPTTRPMKELLPGCKDCLGCNSLSDPSFGGDKNCEFYSTEEREKLIQMKIEVCRKILGAESGIGRQFLEGRSTTSAVAISFLDRIRK